MILNAVIKSLSPKSIREYREYECRTNIKEILDANPENIDKGFFGGEHYIVYSDSYMLGNKKIYDGVVYSIYPNKILQNDMLVSHKFSPEFRANIFKAMTARYHRKYQPARMR